MGVPSVFVRTSGCNLRCSWCDTKYASWHPEGVEKTVDDLISEIQSFKADHVVITGGEPMISRDIHSLAAGIKSNGMHITIETAGTVSPDGIDCDLASISPKLKNSTPGTDLSESWRIRHENTRWKPEIAREWMLQYEYQIKFVVTHSNDIQEIERYAAETELKIPPQKLLIMPEGKDKHELSSHTDIVIELCKAKGYRFCNRLHVDLFGNTRGT